jgi:hypothetical protein
MNKNQFLSLGALSLLLMSNALLAQDYPYHPELSDSFTATLGAMRSQNSFTAQSGLGDEIDFDETLQVSKRTTFFNGQAKWKFGRENKWSFAGQYFSNNATGGVVLTDPVEWDGEIFQEGSFVESGVKLSVARLFFGRSLIKTDRSDLGVGAGLHNLKMELFIEGEILLNDGTTGVKRADVSASQILPNVGAWYNFSPARKWLLHGRVDWIGASIGDYDGHMWNMNAGVNYQAFDHIGFDLSWQYFNLNVEVDKDDWIGGADLTYSGPVLSITGNW